MASASSEDKEDSKEERNPHWEKLKQDIHAILVSSQEAITPQRLEQDYRDLTGRPVPLKEFGLSSIGKMIKAMPDVVKEIGLGLLQPVSHQNTKHIEQLVAQQRPSKLTRFNAKITPEQLQSKVRDALLSILLEKRQEMSVMDFQDEYRQRFGEAVPSQRCFGCSFQEALVSKLSDLVQTRTAEDGEFRFRLRLDSFYAPPQPLFRPPQPHHFPLFNHPAFFPQPNMHFPMPFMDYPSMMPVFAPRPLFMAPFPGAEWGPGFMWPNQQRPLAFPPIQPPEPQPAPPSAPPLVYGGNISLETVKFRVRQLLEKFSSESIDQRSLSSEFQNMFGCDFHPYMAFGLSWREFLLKHFQNLSFTSTENGWRVRLPPQTPLQLDPELKEEIRIILEANPQGVRQELLPDAYEEIFGKDLDLSQLTGKATVSLEELVQLLSDVCVGSNGIIRLKPSGPSHSTSQEEEEEPLVVIEDEEEEPLVVIEDEEEEEVSSPREANSSSALEEWYRRFGPGSEDPKFLFIRLLEELLADHRQGLPFSDALNTAKEKMGFGDLSETEMKDLVLGNIRKFKLTYLGMGSNIAVGYLMISLRDQGPEPVQTAPSSPPPVSFSHQSLGISPSRLSLLAANDPQRNFHVILSQYCNPAEFYVILEANYSQLLDLMGDLNAERESLPSLTMEEVVVGTPCAVDYENFGLHRAQIMKVSPNRRVVKVRFVDYGTQAPIEAKELQVLPDSFLTRMPAQAFRCQLTDLVPPGNSDSWEEGGRTEEIFQRFSSGTLLQMSLKEIQDSGCLIVDVSAGNGRSLSNQLLEEGVAAKPNSNPSGELVDMDELDLIEEALKDLDD